MLTHEAECERVLTRESVLVDPRLTLFQKVLLMTDGSVTELLRIYTGHDIRSHKIEQFISTAGAPAVLACVDDAPILKRKIMLVDDTARHVYAESAFILARLSSRARARLLETDAPIGLLWREERLEMYREIIDLRIERNPQVAAHFGLVATTPLLSRVYLSHQGGQPMGVITEKFPTSFFTR